MLTDGFSWPIKEWWKTCTETNNGKFRNFRRLNETHKLEVLRQSLYQSHCEPIIWHTLSWCGEFYQGLYSDLRSVQSGTLFVTIKTENNKKKKCTVKSTFLFAIDVGKRQCPIEHAAFLLILASRSWTHAWHWISERVCYNFYVKYDFAMTRGGKIPIVSWRWGRQNSDLAVRFHSGRLVRFEPLGPVVRLPPVCELENLLALLVKLLVLELEPESRLQVKHATYYFLKDKEMASQQCVSLQRAFSCLIH